ncbi:MAG: 2-dehydropantoate 2-reductase [Pseudomonadales bacterium]
MNSTFIKPTWYILGAGALGCLWASYWRQAGFPVVLITPRLRKHAFIELHIKREGQSQDKKTQVDIEQLTIDQLAASENLIEYLLVSTKAQHTLEAIAAIKQTISKHATLLILQNGMAAKQLPALLPTQNLITGITTDGAYRTEQNVVVHAGHGVTHFGCNKILLQYLPTQYLTIEACHDIEIRQWQKFAVNCAINGLTAIYQCRNGELLNNPEARQRLTTICDEIFSVAKALGISEHLTQITTQVEDTLRATAENYSSMYQDISHSRSTEIDFINGCLCEIAEKYSISCEENQRVIQEIKNLEAKQLEKSGTMISE